MELSEGGGHAIRPCLCMFREGRPLLPWLHFGLHFGITLGARGAIILIRGGGVGDFFAKHGFFLGDIVFARFSSDWFFQPVICICCCY